MKNFDEKHIKNVVLLGSTRSGKTTLAETMLFEAGLLNRRGTVEDKNTVSDYHEIEQDRGGSVYATSMHTEWRDYKINLIDTPGADDFIGEIVSSVRVADTCLVLLNAQYGVENGTEVIWNYVDQFRKPTILAINQLDHNKADFWGAVEQARERFGNAVTLMQYPLETGEGFNAIIDLLKMTLYRFPAGGGKPEKLPIPEKEKERAESLHNELVEKAAENDESLMELYFEKGSLDEDELRQGLKIGMMHHDVFPVFCLSARNNMGSGRLMGFIDNVAPAAVEAFPEITVDGREIACQVDAPAALFVFKTLIEPFMGRMTFFKVCAGEVKVGDELVNPDTGVVERFGQLFIVDGKNRQPVNKLVAGDIGATVKLKNTQTNHTLHAKEKPVIFMPMVFPEPRVRVAIHADSKNSDEKMVEVIRDLHDEDPTINIVFDKELRQMILSAQGDMHLSATRWRLEHLNRLNVAFENPRIPYRETIQKQATATYRHKKQSGGAGQFAEITLTVLPYTEGMAPPAGFPVRGKEEYPLEWGGKLVFYNSIVGGVIDARFIPSVVKGVMEVLESGPVTNSYCRDVCVVLHDGKMHPVDSNDISFKIAGFHAFREAFMNAAPKILEPVNRLEVVAPDDVIGDIMTDLQGRRAIIIGIDSKNGRQVITAKVPLAEMNGYSSTLKSLSQGLAAFSSRFEEYAPVSYEIQEKLISNAETLQQA